MIFFWGNVTNWTTLQESLISIGKHLSSNRRTHLLMPDSREKPEEKESDTTEEMMRQNKA
jgi:hypothetical protein